MGRPPKIDDPDVELEGLMERLGSSGLIWEEVSAILGFSSPERFYFWLKANPSLRAAADRGRENPNRRVEASLYRRALGYQTREVINQDGKPNKVIIKEVAPDPTSCLFWLKNRDPGRWRDTVHHEFSLRDRMDRAARALGDFARSSPMRELESTRRDREGEEGEA